MNNQFKIRAQKLTQLARAYLNLHPVLDKYTYHFAGVNFNGDIVEIILNGGAITLEVISANCVKAEFLRNSALSQCYQTNHDLAEAIEKYIDYVADNTNFITAIAPVFEINPEYYFKLNHYLGKSDLVETAYGEFDDDTYLLHVQTTEGEITFIVASDEIYYLTSKTVRNIENDDSLEGQYLASVLSLFEARYQ